MKTTSHLFSAIIFSFFSTILAAQDAKSLYEEGLKLKTEKNIKGALEKFKQAASLKTNYTEALYEYGWSSE